MDNKEKFKKIRMEDVYKAIVENGFYTTPTEKHYDENFIGPELIVVTDDPEFKTKHIVYSPVCAAVLCSNLHGIWRNI